MQPFDEPETHPAHPPAEVPHRGPVPKGRHARQPVEPPPVDVPAPVAAAPVIPAPVAPAAAVAPAPIAAAPVAPSHAASAGSEHGIAVNGRPVLLERQPGVAVALDETAYADLPTPRSGQGRPVAPNLLSRIVVVGLIIAALVVAGTVALVFGDDAERGAQDRTPATGSANPTRDPTIGRRAAVTRLLADRGQAVRDHDKAAFLAQIDPTAEAFRAQQAQLFDRLAALPFADWSYELAGEGPALPSDRALQLPRGSAIARVRLHYTFKDSGTPVEREQYLTVVPRGGHWLLGGNDDAASSGLQTERDIWDVGPVHVVRGKSSLVLGDAPRAELTRLAGEADRGVRDVDGVWRRDWSRHPVIVFPTSQRDMATLIGSDGQGLSQIAAVTTGSFESGLSRGDRVVVNPAAWRSLGPLGRRVVLAHEMTHLATRAITVDPVPIWLSEGFADFVAYKAVKVPTSVVAGDVFDDVRKKKAPSELPGDKSFDAARGDIASAYESAWLACRMIADRYGQGKLIQLYASFADSRSAPPGGDIKATLGISEQTLVRQWRAYLASQAKG